MIRKTQPADGGVPDALGDSIGFDGPLCEYCNADVHKKPDCPIKASQDEVAKKIRAEREAWEQKTYGIPRSKRKAG